MKIAFDEHVPKGMARVFKALANEKGFTRIAKAEIVFAADYAPKPGDADHRPKDDGPWLRKFAADGGRLVISGDAMMKSRPHELQALLDLKLVVIFFEGPWSQWPFGQKSALILFHWANILKKARYAKKDRLWTLVTSWNTDTRWRNDSPGRKPLSKRARKKHKESSKPAGGGTASRSSKAQGEFEF